MFSPNVLQAAPGPHKPILLSGLSKIQRDPLKFQLDMLRQYGNLVRFSIIFSPTYLAYHPEHVKHILQSNHQNYAYSHKVFEPYLGEAWS